MQIKKLRERPEIVRRLSRNAVAFASADHDFERVETIQLFQPADLGQAGHEED